mmetsp:Transcript_18324/g.50248  ORF Transcript_18324/g.50248 Transcript_18324/m.50248 type:complete len:215 (+) Transcript_18324:528-1172(+)
MVDARGRGTRRWHRCRYPHGRSAVHWRRGPETLTLARRLCCWWGHLLEVGQRNAFPVCRAFVAVPRRVQVVLLRIAGRPYQGLLPGARRRGEPGWPHRGSDCSLDSRGRAALGLGGLHHPRLASRWKHGLLPVRCHDPESRGACVFVPRVHPGWEPVGRSPAGCQLHKFAELAVRRLHPFNSSGRGAVAIRGLHHRLLRGWRRQGPRRHRQRKV